MKTQMRLSLPRTRAALGMRNRMTGTFYDRNLEGWRCGGRKIIKVRIGVRGKVEQTAMGCETEIFTDGLGVKIDTELKGERPIIKVAAWREHCKAVDSRGVTVYRPNLDWRFMGVAIMWLEPRESGALLATDQNGHQLYIHASDEALIDD